MSSATRLRIGLSLCAALFSAFPAQAAELTAAQVRAFLARQERDWNAGALDAYFAGFRPDAVFTDQHRTPAGQVIPYGSSPLAKARIQSRKFRAASKVAESGRIVRLAIAPDGKSAQVVSQVTTRTTTAGAIRVTCAERRQDLVLSGGRLRSKGQTDTFSRCRP